MTYLILGRYLKVIRQRVWLLFWLMVSSAAGAAVLTLMLARTYTARATFLTSSGGGTSSSVALSILAKGTGGGGGISGETIYHLIQSRRMAEGIVEHFRNDQRFEISNGLTVRNAQEMVGVFEVSSGGLMGIEITSSDPVFSKEAANFCVGYLNIINEQMNLTPEKPMVKMLDPAEVPIGNARHTPQKTVGAALLAGLSASLFFILIDFLKQLRWNETDSSVTEILKGTHFASDEGRPKDKTTELHV